MRPPHPMVHAAEKGSLDPASAKRFPACSFHWGMSLEKALPGDQAQRRGGLLWGQDKPASGRSVLRRPNLARSPSLFPLFVLSPGEHLLPGVVLFFTVAWF